MHSATQSSVFGAIGTQRVVSHGGPKRKCSFWQLCVIAWEGGPRPRPTAPAVPANTVLSGRTHRPTSGIAAERSGQRSSFAMRQSIHDVARSRQRGGGTRAQDVGSRVPLFVAVTQACFLRRCLLSCVGSLPLILMDIQLVLGDGVIDHANGHERWALQTNVSRTWSIQQSGGSLRRE